MEKMMFAKIMGEIYRTQKRVDPDLCKVSDATIYGLLNGFEEVIDEQIRQMGTITSEQVRAVSDVLDEYFSDPDSLDGLKGYYDIEHKLEAKGIKRHEAIAIITYLKANNQFTDVIEKFNSSASPVECKRFDIADYDR